MVPCVVLGPPGPRSVNTLSPARLPTLQIRFCSGKEGVRQKVSCVAAVRPIGSRSKSDELIVPANGSQPGPG